MRTRENITEFCLTREINLISNKTKLNILYIIIMFWTCKTFKFLNDLRPE